MSDATLIAKELQDLAVAVMQAASVLESRAAAQVVVNVPESPVPVVHVAEREIPAPTVTVNVPETVVNVRAPDPVAPAVTVAPNIVIPAPEPATYVVTVTSRDQDGFIQEFIVRPMAA